MGIFGKIFGNDSEDEPSSDQSVSTKDESETDNEFAVDFSDFQSEVRQGKETKVIGDHDVYAGEWAREMMEGAKKEPEQPIWIGHSEPDPLEGPKEVPIPFDTQFTHVAMFGSTGMGKSTVLKNMMVQWAFGGHGFCYIDPKGDDSKELVQMIPEDRLDDVIWIEPSPEEFDKVIGINFLDPSKEYGDEGFEKEVANIINDVIPMLRNESYWGARMDEVVRGFLRAMLYLGAKNEDESYTLVDLYKLLTDQESRHSFAEKAKTELGDEDILQNALQKFAEIDDKDLGAARRRLQEWVISKDMQQVIAHTDSKINITKAVEDGKIIIVRTASISDETVQESVATVVIRRIWAAIQMRDSIPRQERDPFFLCVDEFDDVVNKESDIGGILSKARSLNLGTVLANQQPHQLDREVQEDVFGNCNTLLALNPQNPDDAQSIARAFDTDRSNITELGKYQVSTSIEVNEEPSEVFSTQTFPEYPPVRSREEAHQIRQDIVDEYGVEPIQENTEDVEGTKFDPKNHAVGEYEDSFIVSDDDDEMSLKEILRAIYTAQIKKGGAEKFVTVEEVEDVIELKTGGSTNYNKVSNVLVEKVESYYIEKQIKDNVEIRLSNHGQEEAFTQDTGKSASAGKEIHRYLLQLSNEMFTRLGYDFEAPEQVGGKQPDGLAYPPIDPINEADSTREMQKLMSEFDENNPRMKELFGYDSLSIEAEKSTESKPKQPLKNLIKAVESGKDCVFVVPDGKITQGGKNTLDVHANKIYGQLKEPPMIANFVERDGGAADRHFYNKNSTVKMSGNEQRTAIKPDTDNTVWRHNQQTGELFLESPEGEPVVVFDSIEDIQSATAEDFEYTGQWNQKQNKFVVQDAEGNEALKVESTEEKTPTQRLKEHGFSKIKEPFVPELEFPGGELPDDEQWHIIVLPSSERDFGPRYMDKETRELKPVFENDEPLSSDKVLSLGEELEEPEEKETKEPEEKETKEPEEKETKEPRPKVSDGKKPPSTNDVVKSSDEEWSKPEAGDEDYNPAKDNTNFTVGFGEDYTGEDWTGGDARAKDKEGDFEDYEPPTKTDESDDEDDTEDDNDKGRGYKLGGLIDEPDEN
jgi:hypothetical protein